MNSKLLIVDDEEHTREAVAEYLSEMGYSLICAEDGQQANKLFPNYNKHWSFRRLEQL